jgi:hypothetical protein
MISTFPNIGVLLTLVEYSTYKSAPLLVPSSAVYLDSKSDTLDYHHAQTHWQIFINDLCVAYYGESEEKLTSARFFFSRSSDTSTFHHS